MRYTHIALHTVGHCNHAPGSSGAARDRGAAQPAHVHVTRSMLHILVPDFGKGIGYCAHLSLPGAFCAGALSSCGSDSPTRDRVQLTKTIHTLATNRFDLVGTCEGLSGDTPSSIFRRAPLWARALSTAPSGSIGSWMTRQADAITGSSLLSSHGPSWIPSLATGRQTQRKALASHCTHAG